MKITFHVRSRQLGQVVCQLGLGGRQVTLIDYSKIEGQSGEDHGERFQVAEPFPHAVINEILLGDSGELANAVPDPSWTGWADRTSQRQPGKWSCRDIDVMPHAMRDLILELSGPRFLEALQRITSIDALLPDLYLQGGGLQCMDPGGKLTPHTDFHRHPNFRLFRRVNVLLYLNPAWRPGDGGELVLFDFDDGHPIVTVPPRFGSCVIFATDHRSIHGVQPLTGAGRRSSIALFYYTIDDVDVFSGDRPAYWYPPTTWDEQDLVLRARSKAKKTALVMAKALTHAAYRVDPQKANLVGGGASTLAHVSSGPV